jgi:hypothetical protein
VIEQSLLISIRKTRWKKRCSGDTEWSLMLVGNFAAWHSLKARYDKRFYRMWKYYLMCSAGFFRSRQGQLRQLVLIRRQRQTMYRSKR